MAETGTLTSAARAWPFREARKLIGRLANSPPEKGFVQFETGYGPSGLPHIGTFAEVLRTSMVRRAFAALSDVPTRLIAFSDDMDGLRKVPDNVPNADMLIQHLGQPLSTIPDPFGTHDSFGAHNNAQLKAFLDDFGFDYEFLSATECYRTGRFDATLRLVLEQYEEVIAVILPTLGPKRRQTYSPFLPVCPRTGVVLQVPVEERKLDSGTIIYRDPETGVRTETPVTGGRCKLQWKADWAMRWTALEVDYEMSGKDLIDSVRLSAKICRLLGSTPPDGFTYELFLDENGEKISKSRGNGLTLEEWLAYGTQESLAHFMFHKPTAAKSLKFDVIPKAVDDYLAQLAAFPAQPIEKQLDNPVWHIHEGSPPKPMTHLSFAVLLNLANVCHSEDADILWGFISRYAPDATPETAPLLDRLVNHAIAYYRDLVARKKVYRAPDTHEHAALEELANELDALPPETSAEEIQTKIYEIGKHHEFDPMRDWFRALYEVLLGQSQGPRFGSFVAIYGLSATASLIRRALAGNDLGKH